MHKIEMIRDQAEREKWPFVKLFEALKNAGVESYKVDLTGQYQAVYAGSFGTWKEQKDYLSFTPSTNFDAEAIQKALSDREQEKTTYTGFLGDISKAGVARYVVNMQKREVFYFNQDESQAHRQVMQ